MKRCCLAVAAIIFCLVPLPVLAAETNEPAAELSTLVTDVKARLQEGARTESDLAAEIKRFDALLEKYKADKSDEVASILSSKAMLYFEVFNETAVPIACFERIQRDFPATRLGSNALREIEFFKAQEPSKAFDRSIQEDKPLPPELIALVDDVRARLRNGAKTESELAGEIKLYDDLVEKFKADKSDAATVILMSKAVLYLEVLNETAVPIACFERIQRDFPTTKRGSNAVQVIKFFRAQEPVKAIIRSLQAGKPFPNFEEKGLNGQPLSIASLKGKVVLVDFWATWCGPCMRELPHVIEAYQKYKDKGFSIVGISLDTDESALKRFLKVKEIAWPQYCDWKKWESPLVQRYAVQGIPTTFLLDQNGIILARDAPGEELDGLINRALGDK